jgi:hypothetical protein
MGKKVFGECPCALGVLGRHRVTSSQGWASEKNNRRSPGQRARRIVGNGRVGQHKAIDPARKLAHGPRRVLTQVGNHDDDALTELRSSGLVAHQHLGVVRTGQVRYDEPVGLVSLDRKTPCGLERHVLELLDGLKDLRPHLRRRRAGALEDSRDGGDRHASELRHGVDRRGACALAAARHRSPLSM